MPERPDSVSSPPFDYEATLDRVKGKVSLIQRLINTFLRTSDPILENLRKAISEDDFQEVYRLAHSLRGACLNFNAFPAAQRAEVIEQQGLERDLSNVGENLQAFESEYARLKEALQGVLEPE